MFWFLFTHPWIKRNRFRYFSRHSCYHPFVCTVHKLSDGIIPYMSVCKSTGEPLLINIYCQMAIHLVYILWIYLDCLPLQTSIIYIESYEISIYSFMCLAIVNLKLLLLSWPHFSSGSFCHWHHFSQRSLHIPRYNVQLLAPFSALSWTPTDLDRHTTRVSDWGWKWTHI